MQPFRSSIMDRQFCGTAARLTYLLLPIWSGFLVSGLNGLRNSDVTLVVPQVILQGETLVMDCRFPANESAFVDSVKWYKGKREFFRYTPKGNPRTLVMQFSDKDIQVDENQSDLNKIVVKDVPAAFRGEISCEVTTEPLFTTVYLTSYLQVAVPPTSDPLLTVDVIKRSSYDNGSSIGLSTWHQGLRTKYDSTSNDNVINFGDTIVARCVSGPSTPAVDLRFQINEHPTSLYRNVSIHQELIEDTEQKSATKIATMNLTLQHDTFNIVSRKINIKCLANLFHLYNASSNEVVKELPRESSVTASSYGHGGNGGSRLRIAIELGNMVLLLLLQVSLLQRMLQQPAHLIPRSLGSF